LELRVHELAQLFNSMAPTPFHSKALDHKAETFLEVWARGFYTIARERLTIAGGLIWDRQAARPSQRPDLQHPV
jgi:hypothetical protein